MTLGVHGLRVAANDPALAAIHLHRQAFDPELSSGLDDECCELEDGDDEPPVVSCDTMEAGAGEAVDDDADLDDDDELAFTAEGLDSLFA